MLEVVISPSLAASSDCKESLTWSEGNAALGALSDREGRPLWKLGWASSKGLAHL